MLRPNMMVPAVRSMCARSQQVLLDGLAARIQFDPAVKFTVQEMEDGFSISGDGFDADKTYSLKLLERLTR